MQKVLNSDTSGVLVKVAANKTDANGNKAAGWDHFDIEPGQTSHTKTTDPDGFVCYDKGTGALVPMIWKDATRLVWRIHDGNIATIKRNAKGAVEVSATSLCYSYGSAPICHLSPWTRDLVPADYDFPASIPGSSKP